MANPLRIVEYDDSDQPSKKADERSTSHLTGSHLRLVRKLDEDQPEEHEQATTTGYLDSLVSPANLTTTLDEDQPAFLEPQPSGMTAHAAPPRMKPTIGSRVSTSFRRLTLFGILTGIALGAVIGGAYVVSTTPWLETLVSPPPSEQMDVPDGPAPRKPPPINSAGDNLRDQGTQEFRSGNYSASIDLLNSAVNMYGGDALTYYQLGLAYMAAQGREHALEDAEMAFRTAISLQPDWAAPHQLVAESLLRRGLFTEAITEAKEATRLDPTQYDAWMTLGRAYDGAGKETEARDAFAEAARQAPAMPGNP